MTFGNLLQEYEKQEMERLVAERGQAIPQFRPGDTIRIKFSKITGSSKRLQSFEGVCIARHNRMIGSTLTIRRNLADIGVEKTFNIYDPNITDIEVTRYGKVRRAKLYYLRKLSGKKAKIKERRVYTKVLKQSQKNAGDKNSSNKNTDDKNASEK